MKIMRRKINNVATWAVVLVVMLTLTANGNSPCLAATSHMTLTIKAKPTANAGPDGAMCQGKPYTVSGATASNAATRFT